MSLAVVSFLAVSCGPSVCDCMNGGKEMRKEMEEAGDDEEKVKSIEEKYNSMKEECEKMAEDMGMEEMMKKAEECK